MSGEQNYTSAILVSGSATFAVSPAIAASTVKLEARVFDQAGNVGTSSTQTTVINPWATSGQQRTTDPTQSQSITFGETTVFPNTGAFIITHPLDFDLSPGTSVGGNPAFVYDSETVNPRPIAEATLDSDPAGSVPANISVQLTWNNGTPQTAVNFSTTGHSAGDVYLLAAQVASAVTTTGAYPWSLSITATFSGTGPITRTVSGTAYVVVSSSSNPFLLGWSLAGVDQLVSVSGGIIYVAGSGGFRVFTGSGPTYTSPANDFGVLVHNGDSSYTYTSKDQWKTNFNSSGQETSLVDPHNVAITYTWSNGLLANVNSPDGALVTLSYGLDFMGHQRINSISEAGSRGVSTIRNSNNVLTQITDPDNSARTFVYDGSNRLINDQWRPLNATFTYDSTTGLFSSMNRGLGTTLNLAPASSQGLATSPAVSANKGVAVITDALNQLATYTMDSLGRPTKVQTPDGAVRAWQLDQAGQPVNYTDPISRVTSYQYQYGSGAGDLKQLTHADGSAEQFQYDGTFHKLTQHQDTLHHLTTMTIDSSTGDLLTIQNALNQVTTQTWSSGLLQTVTDPLGHTSTFQYDANRRLQVTRDALNDLTTLSYDSSGNLLTTQDPLGHVTTTSFDSKNRLINVTDAAGGLWTYSYDPANDLVEKTDPLGNDTGYNFDQRTWQTAETDAYGNMLHQTTTSVYDALGRATTSTDGNNHTTTMTFDAMARVLTEKSPVGGVQTFAYDQAGQLTSTTDQMGHTTTLSYNQRGWQTAVQDPLGNRVTTTYDTEGNVLSVEDARGNFVTMSYDLLNRRVQTQDALGDLSTVVFDAAGNVIAQIDARGNATSMIYDALNRVVAVTDSLNHTVTTVFDAAGNVIRTVDALGNALTATYDNLNRRVTVQDPGGGIATTVYDADSNVVNTIDQLGHKVTYSYDALNRQIAVTDARGGVTTTAFDGANNVVSVTDSVNNTTTFLFDAANRMTQQTDPLNHSSTYAYDLANRLTSTTDRDGRRFDNTYDADNRLTQENWVVSGSTVNTLTFSYDANGNLLAAINNAGAYTMAYDALNRVTQTQEPFGLTLTATYDGVGNRTQLQDSFGGVLTSVYDSANRLTSRQFGGASQTPLRMDLTYTARNQLATQTRYSDLGGVNKVASNTLTYDTAGRLTNLQDFNASGGSIANYTYTYDLASRLQSEQLNGGATKTYTYDAANELTNDGTNAYSFDLNGNRTMTGYTTGTGNQLTNDGVWTYTYDAEGNLTKKSKGSSAETWTYGYDNQNHMVWAKDSATDGGTVTTLATYVYDALGNRLEKDVWTQQSGTTTTTRFGYDGVEVWVDLSGGNALQTRYIHGDAADQLFARISAAGTAAWYLTDRLGSVRDIVNNSGAVIDHLDYDGFGNATETQAGNGDRYKWTGREFDSETGLQYNRARYFDPHAGRWQNQDPTGFNAGDTNLYRYVGNSPLMARDPSGLGQAMILPSTTGLVGASPQLLITVAEGLTGTAMVVGTYYRREVVEALRQTVAWYVANVAPVYAVAQAALSASQVTWAKKINADDAAAGQFVIAKELLELYQSARFYLQEMKNFPPGSQFWWVLYLLYQQALQGIKQFPR